jgi:hypothetical protein
MIKNFLIIAEQCLFPLELYYYKDMYKKQKK